MHFDNDIQKEGYNAFCLAVKTNSKMKRNVHLENLQDANDYLYGAECAARELGLNRCAEKLKEGRMVRN